MIIILWTYTKSTSQPKMH